MSPVRPPCRRAVALVAAAVLASACDAARTRAANEIPLCERCHGGNGSDAPPRSTRGATATTDRGVGAHARHLRDQGDGSDVAAPIPCESCHAVPTDIAGHVDGVAQVRMSARAAVPGTTPRWDPATGRCENVYCHGAGFEPGQAGSATQPQWTVVDGSQAACGSCHAFPPASHQGYPGVSGAPSCHGCHAGTVKADGTIDLASGLHIDGSTPLSGAGCANCHGAPPDTGVHRVHANPADPAAITYGALTVLEDVSPSGGPSYDFGCGHCHPIDAARHAAAAPAAQVELTPPGTPVTGDEIKARNGAGAAYDAGTGRCSSVYCHSSGQETPQFAETPSWTATPGQLGCGGCHGDPPRYASGGVGSATANSHLGYDDSGYESGHFAGMPGPAHNSKHGGGNPAFADPAQAASPITCQACHADTVDPSGVAAGGFFWLDSTGDYELPSCSAWPCPPGESGGDPARLTDVRWGWSQCATCHVASGAAPVRAGTVRPLRHVNGKRDVAFDRRRSLPDGYATGFALAGADPDPTVYLRPYYVTAVTSSIREYAPLVPDAALRTTTAGADLYSTTLESAAYDPATQTCSNVGCHVARQAVVDGQLLPDFTAPPLRWGVYLSWSDGGGCGSCHPQ